MSKKLFCFSFAGGGPSSFNFLKKKLDQQFELIGIPYPGREKLIAKKSIESVEELAIYCSNYIIEYELNQENSEISLLGHCFGGRVAFETAKILIENSVDIENIFLSSTPAPNSKGPKLSHLKDGDLLANITKLTNYETPSWKFEELKILQIPSIRADVVADENYVLNSDNIKKIEKTKLIVIDAKGDQYISADKTKDWNLYATTCTDYQVEGEHMHLLTENGATQLSKIILSEFGGTNK